MNYLVKYPVLLFLAGLCASCEGFFDQRLEVDPPAFEPKIVLHAFINQQDSMLTANVSRNIGIFGKTGVDSLFNLPGATVTWYQDGVKKGDLAPDPKQDNIYSMPLTNPLESGRLYEIRASHPNFTAIRSQGVMPGPLNAQNPAIREDARVGQEGERYSVVEIDIRDQPGVRNFYEMHLVLNAFQYRTNPATGKRDSFPYNYQTFPRELAEPVMIRGIQNSVLLSDATFDGQTYSAQFAFSRSFGHGGNKTIKYTLRVRNVTEDYYKWSASYEKKVSAENNFFSEPVFVHTNIENGLGIFGLYTERVFKIP
jgi:Domain of unknown function (DUF4249)